MTIPPATRTLVFALLVAGLAGGMGMVAYRLGQQSAAAAETAAVAATPTRRATTAPPAVVTNTPTPSPTATLTPGPTPTPTATATNTPTPTPTPIVVITHISALGRLETTEFTMRTMIDLGNEPGNLWENIFGTDRLILVAEGEVVAGVDLSQVIPADIKVQGRAVTITLPPADILYSRIDNERTYVYERNTGLFRTVDPTLESRARLLAEKSLVEWATQRGIHRKAEESAILQLQSLLRGLGFEQIEITFRTIPL